MNVGVEDKVHVHDLQATILHCLGLEHTRLRYHHMGPADGCGGERGAEDAGVRGSESGMARHCGGVRAGEADVSE